MTTKFRKVAIVVPADVRVADCELVHTTEVTEKEMMVLDKDWNSRLAPKVSTLKMLCMILMYWVIVVNMVEQTTVLCLLCLPTTDKLFLISLILAKTLSREIRALYTLTWTVRRRVNDVVHCVWYNTAEFSNFLHCVNDAMHWFIRFFTLLSIFFAKKE